MELIYANELGEEKGILKAYTFDLAFGKNENDFALSMPLANHCMDKGYFLYIDGTEYGGIVDKVYVNNKNNTVTYKGRTWHGILAGAVICPPAGFDYYTAQGDANAILGALVEYLGLINIFTAATKESDIDIGYYQFDRYINAYSGILAMLGSYGGKLIMKHETDKVLLSAEFAIDYSINEEWDSTQVGFTIGRNYRPVNHVIALGQGDLSKRAVIHLFTDENGGVQPYYSASCPKVNTPEGVTYLPTNDSHYNLTTNAQILRGVDEVAEKIDYSNAGITENYVLLTAQPANWNKTYSKYFIMTENGYEAPQEQEVTSYAVQTAQPSNWATAYGNYYTKSGSEYKSVEGIENISYTQLTQKPADFDKSYSNYYYYYSDGVTSEYKSVSGDTKYNFKAQTEKPTNWATNYGDYYQKKKKGGYEKVKATSKGTAPTWKAKKYYTRYSYSVAPDYTKTTQAGTRYYRKVVATSAPTWAASKYYTLTSSIVKPAWAKGKYYELQYDRYAELVKNALEKLQASWNCDEIKINLDATRQEYDVCDIVGANDNITGIKVWQPITKKIVTVEQGNATIKYEIGGK